MCILQNIYIYILLYYYITMERVTKSIKIDPELWTQLSLYCIKNGITRSNYVEDLIKKDLKQK